MWDKDDPKTKWLHLAAKIVGAIVIFKLGVLVGEFKIIKSMVVGGAHQPKMLMRAGEGEMGNRFFQKGVMMGDRDDVMFWKKEVPAPEIAPAPPAPPAPPAQ